METKEKNPKKIVFTNNTPNIAKLIKEYDQKKYEYKCIFFRSKKGFFDTEFVKALFIEDLFRFLK